MMPSFVFGETEDRVVARDRDVADGRQTRAAAERRAVDARDHRLAAAIDRAIHLAHPLRHRRRSASKLSSSDARIQLMSAPPQKILPSPASTTARTAASPDSSGEDRVEFADDVGVEGVANVGARQRHAGDAAVHGKSHGRIGHAGRFSLSSKLALMAYSEGDAARRPPPRRSSSVTVSSRGPATGSGSSRSASWSRAGCRSSTPSPDARRLRQEQSGAARARHRLSGRRRRHHDDLRARRSTPRAGSAGSTTAWAARPRAPSPAGSRCRPTKISPTAAAGICSSPGLRRRAGSRGSSRRRSAATCATCCCGRATSQSSGRCKRTISSCAKSRRRTASTTRCKKRRTPASVRARAVGRAHRPRALARHRRDRQSAYVAASAGGNSRVCGISLACSR